MHEHIYLEIHIFETFILIDFENRAKLQGHAVISNVQHRN